MRLPAATSFLPLLPFSAQLPALKAAYAHYSAGREGGLSLAQWVRQLVDCGLAVRIKPGQAAPPPAAAAAGLDVVPRQGGAPPLPPPRERPAGLDDMHVRGRGEGERRETRRRRQMPCTGGGGRKLPPSLAPPAELPPLPSPSCGMVQGRRMADVDAAMSFLASLSEEDSAAQQYTPATMSAAQVRPWGQVYVNGEGSGKETTTRWRGNPRAANTPPSPPSSAQAALALALPPRGGAAAAAAATAAAAAAQFQQSGPPKSPGRRGPAQPSPTAAASRAAAAPPLASSDVGSSLGSPGGPSSGSSSGGGGGPLHLPPADAGLSFSEWLEGLMRVALFKWNDGAMAGSEKLARVVDALAVRLTTVGVDPKAHDDGGPLMRAAAVRLVAAEKAAAARAAAARGPTLMGGR